jgi:uncharacterized membrane protein
LWGQNGCAHAKADDLRENVKSLHRAIKRSYVLWGIGIMISALELTSIGAGGFSLSIEHPEIIQGVLYLAALEGAISPLFIFRNDIANPFCKPVALRCFLWSALPRGTRSFRNADLKAVREKASGVIDVSDTWLE